MSQSRPEYTSSTFARDFVGRQTVIERLTSLCHSIVKEGAPWGVCITGEPGSGKSALLAEILRRMKDSDAFVLAHAAGDSPRASSVDAMLRRWINELSSALGAGEVDLAENVDPKILDMTFASLLGRMASQRRVVVLIDALDQFKKTARGRFATCLPRPWPANARLVATAIAGGASKMLAERPGVEALSLAPLDAAEARGIIEGMGDSHQRKLEPPVIDALLAKKHAGEPASGNPLWLVLAVEELNLLDADDLARLRNSMLDSVEAMPADILRLYRATFDRAAELFGAATVQAFLGLIVV
ncbi:MAG: ATP-binding protein, partial [Terriglobia bacterium]